MPWLSAPLRAHRQCVLRTRVITIYPSNHSSSIGETFPLEWMLRKRVEEHLSRNCPPVPFSVAERGKEGGCDLDTGMAAAAAGGDGAPAGNGGSAASKHDGNVNPKEAIDATIEVTGVSAELAAYALHVSKVCRYANGKEGWGGGN